MIIAAIDLGSNAVRLKIVGCSDGETRVIDRQNIKTQIGEEVYKFGTISHESINHLLSVMEHFKRSMADFGVTEFRAVSTGAMRDATNGIEVREIIRMRTGVKVEILEDSIEKYLTYKSMRDVLPNYRQIRESAIVVEVNSGGTDVTIYKKNKLMSNDELRLGFKVTKSLLSEIKSMSGNYAQLLKKYIKTESRRVIKNFGKKSFNHFLAVGGSAKLISEITGAREVKTVDDFRLLCDSIYVRNSPIMEKAGDDWDELLISMVIFDVFCETSKAKFIDFPKINLIDGVISSILEEIEDKKANDGNITTERKSENDIYSMTEQIAKKYNCVTKHIKNVEANALIIFDALAEKYEFNPNDRKLLRLAAILNETGRYTKLRDYEFVSFDTISNLDIFGVTRAELLIVAHISRNLITGSEILDTDEKTIRVRKLSAILAMAQALDFTRSQKVLIYKAILHESRLEIALIEGIDATLEKISFAEPAKEFFKNFGIEVEIIN